MSDKSLTDTYIESDEDSEFSVEAVETLRSPIKSRRFPKKDIQSVLIRETQGGDEWVRGVGIVRIEDPEHDMPSSSPGSIEEDNSVLTDSVYHLRRVLDDHRIIGFSSDIPPRQLEPSVNLALQWSSATRVLTLYEHDEQVKGFSVFMKNIDSAHHNMESRTIHISHRASNGSVEEAVLQLAPLPQFYFLRHLLESGIGALKVNRRDQ